MQPEQLKELDQVALPDRRAELFSVTDATTDVPRPLALSDLHARAALIELHPSVPEFIRSHFATAQNLLLYAWFYYPFTVTAHFMSLVSVEYALRVRFQAHRDEGFKSLVRRAVREGLVRDQGFAHLRRPPMSCPAPELPAIRRRDQSRGRCCCRTRASVPSRLSPSQFKARQPITTSSENRLQRDRA